MVKTDFYKVIGWGTHGSNQFQLKLILRKFYYDQACTHKSTWYPRN